MCRLRLCHLTHLPSHDHILPSTRVFVHALHLRTHLAAHLSLRTQTSPLIHLSCADLCFQIQLITRFVEEGGLESEAHPSL